METTAWDKTQAMTAFAQEAAAFRLPRWEQIPSLGLYMDQVVTVVEKSLTPLLGFSGEAFITAAMFNNYVKLGMVRKPEKKKYSREHIAGLLVITVLKQSLAIRDIRQGMDTVLLGRQPAEAYDSFCDDLERALRLVGATLLSSEKTTEIDLPGDPLILMAACSFATRLYAAKMLAVVRDNAEQENERQQ